MSFFDKHPVLYPWPGVLRKHPFLLYKPREVWWSFELGKLKLEKRGKVLEVGCGRGILLDRLTGKYQVKGFGIDIAEKVIAQAREESVYKHDLRVADACKLPFGDNFFEAVISFDTLEHVTRQEKAVEEMVRVLKPGGRILIYTINARQRLTWNWSLGGFDKLTTGKLGINIYKNVDHDPKLFVEPAWLKGELERRGIRVIGQDYFNAFFSLAVDEVIMVFLLCWQRFFGWEKTENFGRIILKVLTLFSVATTPILRVLDLPWTIFGYSNGFLVLGEKR